MKYEIVNLWDGVFDELWFNDRNVIQEFVFDDQFGYGGFDSMESVCQQLEFAHCAAGSFGGMIYTRDILDRLSDSQWREAIGEAWDSYCDAIGESPNLGDSGDILESLVTFAVDWFSSDLASMIRANGPWYIVTDEEEMERRVFRDHWQAQEYIDQQAEKRFNNWLEGNPKASEEDCQEEHDSIFQQFSIGQENT